MVPNYWDPRLRLGQLRDEMNRMVSNFTGTLDTPWLNGVRGQPATNVWETDEGVMVELEVPGLKSDQLEIAVVDNELSVKINRPDEDEEGVTYHRRERPVGAFTRVLRLPTAVDADRVAAELRDGVLRINLPKAETARPRKIQVTSG